MGRLDGAREHFEADLALRRELVAHDPRNQRWREFLGTSHQYLGALLLARGDLAAARPHLEASAELFDELAARDPGNGDWRYKQAWSQLRIGRLETAEGRREAGLAAWRRADGIARGLAEADPERIDWLQLVGVVLRDRPAHDDEDVVRAVRAQAVHDPGHERHVRTREDRDADRVRVLLDRGLDDLLRRLVETRVDDLHAGVPQGPRDDLRAAVVTVQSGLGDHHPNTSARHIGRIPRCA